METYILYVCDTETTGFEVDKHEIIELSLIRVNLSDKTESQKTWLIRALNPSTISEEALKKNGHKREDILHQTDFGKKNYIAPEKAIEEIEQWISLDMASAHDRIFAGQNPEFDFKHIEALWKKYNAMDMFPFSTGINKLIIDTKQIAIFIDICMGFKREKYNLVSLVKDFGVKKGTAHRAEDDTRMTKDLLIKMISGLQPHIKDIFTK